MKKSFLFSIAMLAASLYGVQAQETNTDVNQYGQKVTSTPIQAEMQDGILVFKNDKINYKIWFDIRVQGDVAVFFGAPDYADKIGNGMSIRRARFAVKAQLDKNWYGEIDTDWTSGLPEIKDAIIAYTGISGMEIKAGNFKENFSIQRNTTSRYLVFMERPMVTSLAPSRHLGINVKYSSNWYWLSAGVFGPELKDSEAMGFMQDYNKDYGMNEGLSYTGKVVLRPIYKNKNASLHIGGAFSWRNPKTTQFKIKDFEELIEEDEDIMAAIEEGKFAELDVVGTAFDSRNSTDINRKKYLNTGDLLGVDHEIAYTFEVAGHNRGLRYEAAYIAKTACLKPEVCEVTGTQDRVTGDGFYIQASYLLFGGTQAYDANGAKYTRTTAGRSWGDLELAARFQRMDLNDGDITGGSANAYELGLNFYPNKNVKIILNYQFVDQDKYANGSGSDKGKLYCGLDADGNPTKVSSEVVGKKKGVDYQMLALRFQIAF